MNTGDYMFKLFQRFLQGYLEIEARGFAVERFINLAVHNNTTLWDMERQKGVVKFKAKVKDFRKLSGFGKKCGVKIKIRQKFGCPFFVYRYKKRYVFIAGVAIFLTLLLYMSSFIWLIEVEGNIKIDDYEILSVLSEKGLKTGAFKYKLNTESLEEHLKGRFDNLSWINIKIEGTRATVTVTEGLKDTDYNTDTSPCNIVADKNALITDIITTRGKPMVKAGDMVKEGDILISADVTYLQDGEEVLFNQVHSSGTIKGKVVRTFTKTVPYTVNLKRYTGNVASFYKVKIFNTNFNTNFIKSAVSFQKYDIIREIKQLGLGEKFMLPVYVEKLSYKEYNTERLTISAEEAKNLAAKGVNNLILEQYPTAYDIIDNKVTYTKGKGNITASAKVTAIESLGKESYITPIIYQGGNAINGTTENANSE